MQHPTRNGRRNGHRHPDQLSLALSWLSEEDFLAALKRRGATSLERVRFKPNRTRLVSLSADRKSLNVQASFRAAPGDVIDAIAVFATAPRVNAAYRAAIRRLRVWWETQTEGFDAQVAANGGRRAACCGTAEQRAFLASAYERLNRLRFGERLPGDIPIRLSSRMSRRFGHVHYGRMPDGRRFVEEIALNVDLMIRGNEKHFLDTLLHEMAHVEAWVLHGHRDHGPLWRCIAERVGCEPNACSAVRIRRRHRRAPQVTSVPRVNVLERAVGRW
jgi:hypothetical protein